LARTVLWETSTTFATSLYATAVFSNAGPSSRASGDRGRTSCIVVGVRTKETAGVS
jgi:hypothetical protein